MLFDALSTLVGMFALSSFHKWPNRKNRMAYNILLVDDSNVVKAVLMKILAGSSLTINQVFDAANGVEALKILNANAIDLVITDINMPVMDGFELIERMNLDIMLKNIPVIVVSTEGSLTRVSYLEEMGIRGYVRKPFVAQDIISVINDVLGAKNG
jgi:two-component system, chemotaxis family, chemotaxis protein CheY